LGNPEQIHRAVSNLIGNAIQYTPKGKITVMLCRYQAMALIKVCDTGIGIAPEEQRHIFDRFYRVDQVRSRHKGGSGLGLAITKAIAQAHRGSLLVESQPNKGSVFTLALPLLDKPSLNQVLAFKN
jgi:signal transduction histidine kinase